MHTRCSNPKCREFHFYGGRGITVDPRWKVFANFLEDMGEVPPDRTIERIDNNKGYFKANCRWATTKEQANNRRSSRWITIGAETLTMTQWSERTGIKVGTIWARLDRGLSPEEALCL